MERSRVRIPAGAAEEFSVSVPPPRVATVARKRPRSFCQKRRWQVTVKHAYILRIYDFAGSDMVPGCIVYTERAEMAAVSCGTSHASAVSTHHFGGYSKNVL